MSDVGYRLGGDNLAGETSKLVQRFGLRRAANSNIIVRSCWLHSDFTWSEYTHGWCASLRLGPIDTLTTPENQYEVVNVLTFDDTNDTTKIEFVNTLI